MPSSAIGATLSALAQADGSPVVTRTNTGDVIERKYNLKRSSVKSITDALTFGTADSEYTNSFLSQIRSNPVGAQKAEITLIYEPANIDRGELVPAVGTVIKEIDANAIEIPIGTTTISDSGIQERKKEGIESFLSPQPIYQRTEILSAFTFNETNAINDVGKIDDSPNGLASPTADKWLKVGFVVRSVGDKFEKTERWQYASAGWDTEIYTTVA